MFTIYFSCGGLGMRFQDTCAERKPCQLIFSRPMYKWVIDTLIDNPTINNSKNDLKVVVQEEDFGFNLIYEIQKEYFNNFNIEPLYLPYITRGPIESFNIAFNQTKNDNMFWILDNDILYDKNINWDVHNNENDDRNKCYVLVQKINDKEKILYNNQSPYSHVKIEDNHIVDIVEKVNIGEYIVIGAYGFSSRKTFEIIFEKFNHTKEYITQEWYMSLLIKTALDMNIKVIPIYSNNSISIGIPSQVEDAIVNHHIIPKKMRWVFDLDQTLVTLPKIVNDYKSSEPIMKTINFLRFLYNNDHYIIIHTARHMLSCKGDVKMIEDKIGDITRIRLKELDIPYHELIFGKPYGDIYIDDKSTNPNHWTDKWITSSIGFGWKPIINKTRVTHKIIKINDELCYKYCTEKEFYSLKNYMETIPIELKNHMPKIYDFNKDEYKILMEWKNDCICLNKLKNNSMLNDEIFNEACNMLNYIHSFNNKNNINSNNIISNYNNKLKNRILQFDIFNKLIINTDKIDNFFNSYVPNIVSIIHGDYWFSNILWNHKLQKIFFIDIRGYYEVNNKIIYETYGDIYYDYAKFYQSICGYDYLIEKRKNINEKDILYYEKLFMKNFNLDENSMNKIRKISAYLMLGSIPFHTELHDIINDVKILINKTFGEELVKLF